MDDYVKNGSDYWWEQASSRSSIAFAQYRFPYACIGYSALKKYHGASILNEDKYYMYVVSLMNSFRYDNQFDYISSEFDKYLESNPRPKIIPRIEKSKIALYMSRGKYPFALEYVLNYKKKYNGKLDQEYADTIIAHIKGMMEKWQKK